MEINTSISRWIFWNLLSRGIINVFIRMLYRFRVTPKSDRFPRPPFLVIANHGTFVDPWMVGDCSRFPIAIMMNDDGFRGRGVSQWYLKRIGTFPKKKGASDFKAMRLTLDKLKRSIPVCIFPEGQTSWDGETQLMYRGIEKLVKRAKCPLVMVKLQGNFLSKPWWAKTRRSGRVLLTTRVLKAEEIVLLDEDALFATMRQYLYQNDIKDPANAAVPFRGNMLAEGLERFVWICMKCKAEDTLVSNGNSVHCTACGYQLTMDAHCRLMSGNGDNTVFADLKDWADWHRTLVREKTGAAQSQVVLTESLNVALLRENSQKLFVQVSVGSLRLTPEELQFSSANVTNSWPVAGIEDYVIQKKDLIEFRCGTECIRFGFDKHSPMKWIYYVRYLKGYAEKERLGYL